jgi:radical SAM superfamily enzyme YgiQ (UPF0313 family)
LALFLHASRFQTHEQFAFDEIAAAGCNPYAEVGVGCITIIMRIFLADLGHNQVTISSDIYPLGVANLTTYAQAYYRGREPLDIRLFKEPQDLKAALDSQAPDVLGLSSYAWNHKLSLTFARYARARNPNVVTVMGGPNYPLTSAEQESFLRSTPEIDIAVRGPTYEGERAFLNFVQRFYEAGRSLKDIQTEPLPGSDWIDCRTGDFVHGAELDRIQDLDEIPSPYLAGLMDAYFSTGYLPMMQIARGCPFSCTFCNSSVATNSRIHSHSLDNVKADLEYIAQRVQREVALTFADDNFGMYPLDEEVADFIADLQSRYGWPSYIRTTTGKNKGERIIKVMRKIRGALPMTAAVQSLNPVVLHNIKRSNIKLETYTDIQKEVRAQGMQSYGELILCLPGETKASIMRAIRDLLDTGVTRVSAHQLMLLHGAPLSNPEERRRFGFRTRFRVVARNIGNYTSEPVIETEEMVVETPTFTFSEYLETRVFHLLLTIFYYEGNFEEAFQYAQAAGVKPFDVITRLHDLLPQAPAAFRKVIEDFVRESQDELFESEEACLAWARRNFDALVEGSTGGNLLSKYSMLGRFYVTREATDFLEAAIGAALSEKDPQTDLAPLRAVMDYLRVVLLHVPFRETLDTSPQWTTSWDVESWSRNGYGDSLAVYRLSRPITFSTAVPAENRAVLENRLATFGERPSGLGKFTRTLFAKDLRRVLVTATASAQAGFLIAAFTLANFLEIL